MRLTQTLTAAALLLAASATGQPLDTSFTYQGRLTDGGSAPTGVYDLPFTLYDASAGGAPVAPSVLADDVAVTKGLFTVTLDFGPVFAGSKRFLEVATRPGSSTGPYTTLSPRQELTATPIALYSAAAGTAASAAAFTG